MRTLFPLLGLLLVGCQSKPSAVSPVSLPLIQPATGPDARIPAVIGHYTLGAYVDPDNELIRHEAHTIQRVEAAARWDLRPVSPPAAAAPIQTEKPEQISAADEIASASPLEAPVPPITEAVAPVQPVEPPAVVVAPPPAPRLPTSPGIELEPAIMPNADGVIDLTAIALTPEEEGNPFAVRRIGADNIRELTLSLGGIIDGSFPCVLVNGRAVQPGESIEGLVLVRVERDSALFRHGEHRVRLPVAANSVRVRVAL